MVRSFKDGNNSLKAVQKLLINTVGETTQHRKPATSSSMFKASHDFIITDTVQVYIQIPELCFYLFFILGTQ